MTAFLFIHGWATDSVVWNDTAKAVWGADRRLNPLRGLSPFNLNINLPGHGGKGSWDEPSFVPAVREVMARMANLPERSVVGIGWSLGAQILLSAIKQGAQFKGLVLVGATPRFTSGADWTLGQPKALVRRMIQDMKKAPEIALKRFYELNFTPGELKTPEAAAFVNRYKYPGLNPLRGLSPLRGPIECQAGLDNSLPGCFPSFKYAGITAALQALYREDLRDALGAVKCPCLIVHGDKDAVCPVEAGRFLAENIKGARLEVFKDCGHAPFLTHRELFTRLVKEFTEKL